MKRILILAFILVCSFNLYAQPTKGQGVIDDWFELASNAVGESSELDVSAMLAVDIHIQHALTTSGTAQDVGAFFIQVSSATSGNEDWQTLFTIPMKTGTANSEAMTATEPIGETTIAVASTTGLYENDGTRWMLLKDNVLATSEMIFVVSAVANTSIIIQDGIKVEHTSADTIFDIADSRTYLVDVFTKKRLRIIADNTLDAGGPQLTIRYSYTENTGIGG